MGVSRLGEPRLPRAQHDGSRNAGADGFRLRSGGARRRRARRDSGDDSRRRSVRPACRPEQVGPKPACNTKGRCVTAQDGAPTCRCSEHHLTTSRSGAHSPGGRRAGARRHRSFAACQRRCFRRRHTVRAGVGHSTARSGESSTRGLGCTAVCRCAIVTYWPKTPGPKRPPTSRGTPAPQASSRALRGRGRPGWVDPRPRRWKQPHLSSLSPATGAPRVPSRTRFRGFRRRAGAWCVARR